MHYRALTVSREYGSGGARIAKLIAERMRWELLDAALIAEVARAAHVDIRTARENDERVDSWFHQFSKAGCRAAVAAAGAVPGDRDWFDAEAMAALSRGVIDRAYTQGRCVIVGRGAQCILAGRPDVFHVFISGSEANRSRRLQARLREGADAASVMRSVDEERARYIERFYGRYWRDPRLYNLTISSDPGDAETADAILSAMGAPPSTA
jgi:cytidylate kinase